MKPFSVIEQVLLRKDVASLIVAIVAGTSVGIFLVSVSSVLPGVSTGDISGGPSFADTFFSALWSFVWQILLLEALLRLVILVRTNLYNREK